MQKSQKYLDKLNQICYNYIVTKRHADVVELADTRDFDLTIRIQSSYREIDKMNVG